MALNLSSLNSKIGAYLFGDSNHDLERAVQPGFAVGFRVKRA